MRLRYPICIWDGTQLIQFDYKPNLFMIYQTVFKKHKEYLVENIFNTASFYNQLRRIKNSCSREEK